MNHVSKLKSRQQHWPIRTLGGVLRRIPRPSNEGHKVGDCRCKVDLGRTVSKVEKKRKTLVTRTCRCANARAKNVRHVERKAHEEGRAAGPLGARGEEALRERMRVLHVWSVLQASHQQTQLRLDITHPGQHPRAPCQPQGYCASAFWTSPLIGRGRTT